MITILLQKILAALTQLLTDLKTKLNTIKDNLDDLIVVATASGPIASFTTTLTRALLSCIVNIPKSVSGTDTVIVTQTGVNLWDEEWELGTIDSTTGEISPSNNQIRSKNFCAITGNTTFAYCKLNGMWTGFFWYDANQDYISVTAKKSGSTGTVTSPANARYFKLRFGGSGTTITTYGNDTSLNYPSTDTTYHAHVTATTKTVSLPSTVYGGEVDVIGGIITKTYDAEDLGDLTWYLDGDYFYSDSITDIKSGSVNCLCESGYTYDAALSEDKTFTVSGTQIRFRDDRYTSTPDFKTAVTGIDFIYELSESDTDSITPEVITALNGVNNIFSDSGDITVEYLKLYKEA